MAEESETIADTPGQLLSATHDLALRVRIAQRGTWFPLVLLGLVVMGAAPVYRFGSGGRFSCDVTHGPGGQVVRTCFFSYGWPAFIYWMIALVLAYAVIAGFYRLRARQRGVGSRVRPYVTAGIAGLILLAAFWPVQQHLSSMRSGQVALAVHGLNPLLAIGLALFVLAWVERNWALLAFAGCYLAAVLLASFSDIVRRLPAELGWVPTRQSIFLPGLWLAGGVLLLGGAAFALAERRQR